MKLDRRIVRTRQSLQGALIELTLEHGYDQVTVQHILDRAGVSRSTFYAHYDDKEALFVGSIANLQASLQNHWKLELEKGAGKGNLGFVGAFLHHINGNRHLWRVLMEGQSARILDRQFRLMLTELLRKDFGIRRDASSVKRGAIAGAVGALMSLTDWWMRESDPPSAPELTQLFLDLNLQGLRACLSKDQAHEP